MITRGEAQLIGGAVTVAGFVIVSIAAGGWRGGASMMAELAAGAAGAALVVAGLATLGFAYFG